MGIIVKAFRKAAFAALMSFWIAPTANAVPVNYIVDEAVRNGGPLRDLFDELIIRGTVTVDDEDFDDFGPGQSGFAPIVDFELSLFLDLFFDDEIKPSVLRVTPDTATVTLNRQATRIDENAITIDASGLQPFTPLFDIQIDRFVDEAGLPTEIGFPDGRRLGDEVRDRAAQFGWADAMGFGMRLQIICRETTKRRWRPQIN